MVHSTSDASSASLSICTPRPVFRVLTLFAPPSFPHLDSHTHKPSHRLSTSHQPPPCTYRNPLGILHLPLNLPRPPHTRIDDTTTKPSPRNSRFCLHLHSLLTAPEHAHQRIFLYSSDEPDKKVNAALLMALYAVGLLGLACYFDRTRRQACLPRVDF